MHINDGPNLCTVKIVSENICGRNKNGPFMRKQTYSCLEIYFLSLYVNL